jgi:hypothetical protein
MRECTDATVEADPVVVGTTTPTFWAWVALFLWMAG